LCAWSLGVFLSNDSPFWFVGLGPSAISHDSLWRFTGLHVELYNVHGCCKCDKCMLS
jgi:hypothetical protein